MTKKYTSYKDKELLDDEEFIQSMINPTAESGKHWDTLVEYDLLSGEELEQARVFMETVKKPRRTISVKDKNALWTAIEVKNKKNLRNRIRRYNIYMLSAVASLLLFVSSYLFYQWNTHEEETEMDILAIAQEITPVAGESKGIQLIVGGEKSYVLNQQTADIEMNEEGDIHVDSDLLVTAPDKPKENKVNYNQLVVPKGARSRLTLPDGTSMHINSGTQVVFPEVFTADKREIFVNGEVFLDVVSNKECPFFIRTKQMTVKVTGTSLNVSAYEEDVQTVVLVSGAVTIKTANNEEANLLPNQVLVYNENVSTISTVDVSNYISWKEGYLICDRENLPALMKKLSRFYGKAIHCDSSLSLYQGNGKLDLKDNFDQLIEGLKELYPIRIVKDENDEIYHIKNNKMPH